MKAEGKKLKVFWGREEAKVFAASVHKKGYWAKIRLQHTYGPDLYLVWYWKEGGNNENRG